MREEFTDILIDSRTGVSDTAGICTVQMPDQLIACFTLNNQSIEGAAAVVRSVVDQLPSDFKVYPIPTRIDNSEVDKLRERWNLARQRFDDMLLSSANHTRSSTYWDTFQIPYIPKYSYEEVLASFANLPNDPRNINLYAYVKDISRRIFGVLFSVMAPTLNPSAR